MKLINNANTEYMLEASLESLHAESLEWKNEIEFWNDEMAFFYKLIHLREPHLNFPSAALALLEKDLIRITGEILNQVKVRIESHERSLTAIMKNAFSGEGNDYREQHRRLLFDMQQLYILIRDFKKKVFSFIV